MYSENAWDKYTKEELEKVDALATSYMDFINNGKNERLVVKESIKLLQEKGFKHISEVNYSFNCVFFDMLKAINF